MVIISKTGEIGEIYEIQNLKIALPKANKVARFKGDKWVIQEYPKELKRIGLLSDTHGFLDERIRKYFKSWFFFRILK